MPRRKGAKNIPRTVEQLELELLQRYAAEGKNLPAKAKGKAKAAPAPRPAPTPVKSSKKLELAPVPKEEKEEQGDTYRCGKCQAPLDSELETCPHCGAPQKKSGGTLGAVFLIVLAVFVIVNFMGGFGDLSKSHMKDSVPSSSRTTNPSRSLQSVLEPFFRDIPVVQWVVYNADEVYVGFKANYDYSKPEPLKLIMGNAARLAYDAGHRGFELWAVDATRTDRTWRPENGIEAWLLTKITLAL